jgi:hypothetical protein
MTVDVPQTSRAEAFREHVAEMKIPAPHPARDQLFARVGLIICVLGIGLGVIGYAISSGTNSTLNQNDALILAVIGIPVAITGAAVFLRYSLAGFLRLWLMRLIHEQRKD